MIDIKHRYTGAVLTTVDAANLRGADLSRANLRDANLRGADLSCADLSRADLRDADLSDADLSRADLRDADLSDADLSCADLSRANLRDANLRDANLRGANLRDANLRDANLRGADLRGATLPTGETWEVYCAEVVPALLIAGGSAVTPDAWQCHNWSNCLMACAFGAKGLQDVPVLFRPRAEQLIQFFDAGLLDHLAPKCETPA
jgi:hypothetical protein